MTIAVAVTGKDFVVLGADKKQTSFHSPDITTHRVVEKIRRIGKYSAGYVLVGNESGRSLFEEVRHLVVGDDLFEPSILTQIGSELKRKMQERFSLTAS